MTWLCWLNLISIVVALLWSTFYLMGQDLEHTRNGATTEFIAKDLNFLVLFSAISKFMFSYSGH